MVEILRSKKQKEADQLPSRLEVLREYDKRHALNDKYKDELRRLEAGHRGEMLVLEYLNEYGLPHWKVIKNIWLEHYGIFECDLLLITGINWHPFEIKHYSGQYELKDMQWSCYGKLLPNNPISQSQKVLIHFYNLASENQLPVNIKGSIIFTGEHFDLKIVGSVADLEIITLNQLRDYIQDIAWKEKNTYSKKIDVDSIMNFIEKYETTNPFPAEDLYEALGDKLTKGVKCCHCGTFDVNFHRTYVSCSCGMHEPHEMAIVRTICEYGVIHFNKELVISEVVEFFDGDYSKTTIRKYLNKHFERIGKGRGAKYCNLTSLLEEIEDNFKFDRSKYLLYSTTRNKNKFSN